MTTERKEGRVIATPLAQRVGPDADVARIAEALDAICQEIDAALQPIIGPRGVAALYTRSIHLASAAHPWLTAARNGVTSKLDTAALMAAVSQQSGAAAVAGGSALLEAFHALLASLVGPSLTERLLRTVWAHPTSGSSAQDPST